MPKTNNVARDIATIVGLVPGPRRRQLALLIGLMLLGALADSFTLGAIVPFVSIMSNPAAFAREGLGGVLGTHLSSMPIETQRLLLTGVFIAALIVAGVLRSAVTWASGRFAMLVGHDLGNQVFRNIVRQDYKFHLNDTSANLLAVIQKVQVFPPNVLVPITQATAALITSTFIVIALLIINPAIALSAILSFLFLYMIIAFAFSPIQRKNSFEIAALQPEKARLVQESVGGARDIIVNDLGQFYETKFDLVERTLRLRMADNLFMGQAPRYFVETALLVLMSIVVFVAARHSGDITPLIGTAAAFALGLQRMLPNLQLVYRGWAQISSNAGSTRDIVTYVNLAPPASASLPIREISFGDAIRLDDLSFRYSEGAKLVLSDISIDIGRGQFIGITGKTGSGKSTLVDIIMGLHLPTGGRILIDNEALSDDTLTSWRRNIAHVAQSVFLVEGSVRENIALGVAREEIDEALLQEVVKLAALDTVIPELGDGLDTAVGERGARLSGGQRQRIGIARALYLNREVLVLDEATSALDEQTQTRVMENIRSLRASMTIIAIAHRLETLRSCDRIIRLDKGRIMPDPAAH